MRVMFAPERLRSWHKPYYFDLDIVEDNPDIAFNWNYTGVEFKPLQMDCPVINNRCLNTRKTYVDKVFTDVFGYSSRGRSGLVVKKNDNVNGCKDMVLEEYKGGELGYFYQMPFFEPDQKMFIEYRIIVMGYQQQFTCTKLGRIDGLPKRGQSTLTGVLNEPINDFCLAVGMEYGELDACYFDGKFWIYDINPTPGDRAFTEIKGYREKYKQIFLKWLSEY